MPATNHQLFSCRARRQIAAGTLALPSRSIRTRNAAASVGVKSYVSTKSCSAVSRFFASRGRSAILCPESSLTVRDVSTVPFVRKRAFNTPKTIADFVIYEPPHTYSTTARLSLPPALTRKVLFIDDIFTLHLARQPLPIFLNGHRMLDVNWKRSFRGNVFGHFRILPQTPSPEPSVWPRLIA